MVGAGCLQEVKSERMSVDIRARCPREKNMNAIFDGRRQDGEAKAWHGADEAVRVCKKDSASHHKRHTSHGERERIF